MTTSRSRPTTTPGTISFDGDRFLVPAELIATAFDLAPADVPDLMRHGSITSRSETGVEEDAGRWRITFFYNGRALRLTIDAQGEVLKRALFDTPGRSG
ncbi:DUF6522 family protein [Roseobacter sinensis]|uniref:DUF6522 family protein n=1 Tax=Roseobacter sinensis TaxID=2931391 RepID=A0ABT3BJK9_9RHOB|nr:DUF6522 family protein [Roseobacter sp. WL0113]MCV3273549.1 DUF6522 family protein [Roseobacter sp. WL0113]